MNAHVGRLAITAATTGFLVGLTLLNGGSPTSHTWLDASGQYGPALLDGTDGDDVIVGSDGDNVIDAADGPDFVCGRAVTTTSPAAWEATSSEATPVTTTSTAAPVRTRCSATEATTPRPAVSITTSSSVATAMMMS